MTIVPPRRFLMIATATIAFLLMGQAGVIYCMDPAGIMRASSRSALHIEDPRWRHPGLINGSKQIEVAIIGTSMSESFQAEMFKVSEDRFLNLATYASSIEEQAVIATRLLAQSEPKAVYWELHPSAVVRRERLPKRFQLPEYLYRDTILDRARYLLSPGALGILLDSALRRRGSGPVKANVDTSTFQANLKEKFGPDRVLADLCSQGTRGGPHQENDDLFRRKIQNLLVPIIASHPDVQFTVFVPAFSDAFYWLNGHRPTKGLIDSYTFLAKAITSSKNARFVLFAREEATRDWAHYKDASHHDLAVTILEAGALMSGRSDAVDAVAAWGADALARMDDLSEIIRTSVDEHCWQRLLPDD